MYHLLVVEDESLIRRGIRAFIDFDRLGIDEFFEAENGEEGLEAVRSHRIDLILADINMPKMNGLEFCRLAKELDPSIKIAILTGYDYLDYAIRAIKIGVDDYALKPLSRDDVQKLLFHLSKRKKRRTISQQYVRASINWPEMPVRKMNPASAPRWPVSWKNTCPIPIFPSAPWLQSWDIISVI